MSFLFLIFLSSLAFAKEAPKATALPYLGPGADKLSAEEYERKYKSYIQASILFGYPIGRDQAAPCDQALSAVFRQNGMFAYPVPGDAQVTRSTKVVKNKKVETYQLGGALLQLSRDAKSSALDNLFVVNSGSTRATRKLTMLIRKEILELYRDPVTGLEQVKGIPVGFHHPFLSKDGQGLIVRVLKFNGKVDGCEPVDFFDNDWVGGFDLSEGRCVELQADAERVFKEQQTAEEFYLHEVKRMKEKATASAIQQGAKPEEAKQLVEKNLVPPLTGELNVVGSAMRNLFQCNVLALGRAGGVPKATPAPSGDGKGNPGGSPKGAGSAE